MLSKNMFEALSSDGAADFSSQILSSGSEMATESPGVRQNGQGKSYFPKPKVPYPNIAEISFSDFVVLFAL